MIDLLSLQTTHTHRHNLNFCSVFLFSFFLLLFFSQITCHWNYYYTNVCVEIFLIGVKNIRTTLQVNYTSFKNILKIRHKEWPTLMSMGSWRVGHNWATSLSLFTFMHWRRKWQPTPVFLPGESQGWGSLVSCHLWGHTESDTTEAT